MNQAFLDFLDTCSAFSVAWKKSLLNISCVYIGIEKEYNEEFSVINVFHRHPVHTIEIIKSPNTIHFLMLNITIFFLRIIIYFRNLIYITLCSHDFVV